MSELRRATLQQSYNISTHCCGYHTPPIMPPPPSCCQGGSGSGTGNAGGISQKPSKKDFPTVGDKNIIYIDQSTDTVYYWDGSDYIPAGGATGITQYASESDFPLRGKEGRLYIDKDMDTLYYWDAEAKQYVQIVGQSTDNPSGGDCCDEDECCIWGDILNGGGAEEISPDCPIEHHCCGGNGSGSGSIGPTKLTKYDIIEALGFTPAKASDVEDVSDATYDAAAQAKANAKAIAKIESKIEALQQITSDNEKAIDALLRIVDDIKIVLTNSEIA